MSDVTSPLALQVERRLADLAFYVRATEGAIEMGDPVGIVAYRSHAQITIRSIERMLRIRRDRLARAEGGAA